MTREIGTEHVVSVFLLCCVVFGAVIGFIGLGAGLLFFSVSQALGMGLLSFGAGSMFGGGYAGKRILRAIIDVMQEKELEKVKSQAQKAPVTKEPSFEIMRNVSI